ncbi:hypothetical protein [Arthrobacter sp. 92]|jgi:hypothetical protein|uniref:hypothetical protein n=1 Tax=Arthrobacter sp. 92 TaxID=3418175 RepID=UPI003D0702A7
MPDTQPPNHAPGADASREVLVHSDGPAESAGLTAALRSAANAAAALAPGVPIDVVLQGRGVSLLARLRPA